MKLEPNPLLPLDPKMLGVTLSRLFRNIANQVNALSEGTGAAYYQATTAAPTTGTYAQGDFVANSNITELGTAGNKYTLSGWRCVAGGTPGTWVQCRLLTGN